MLKTEGHDMNSFIGQDASKVTGTVQKIGDTMDTIMATIRPPLIQIPPMLLLCEMLQRPGLSGTILSSEIISKLESIGIPTGVNPDGSENLIVKFVQLISNCIVEHFQRYGRVDSSAAPCSVSITGTGTAAGIAPVAVSGCNSNFISMSGTLR